jgi:8-oxo-dGTP diphosphatase
MIRAAGAVLWRETSERVIELAIIHRPRYDDWSLPKGKMEPGETAVQCAFREVLEETGIRTRFSRHLGAVEYLESGTKKRVQYWAAEARGAINSFTPNEEVDQLAWLPIELALEKVTHESDKEIITNFSSQPAASDTLIILRHTKAIERGDWDNSDSLRTLSEFGLDQAQSLIGKLAPFAIDEIYTSNYTRCVQTVTPLAETRNLDAVLVPNLNEEIFEHDPERSVAFANALKQDEKNILICSHNPVIPTMVRGILNTKLKNRELIKLEPGDAWIVHRIKGEIVGLDYLSIGD